MRICKGRIDSITAYTALSHFGNLHKQHWNNVLQSNLLLSSANSVCSCFTTSNLFIVEILFLYGLDFKIFQLGSRRKQLLHSLRLTVDWCNMPQTLNNTKVFSVCQAAKSTTYKVKDIVLTNHVIYHFIKWHQLMCSVSKALRYTCILKFSVYFCVLSTFLVIEPFLLLQPQVVVSSPCYL